MAEEDIIFGKNRHLFGGIEPSNMSKFEVKNMGGEVFIDAELPNDTVINKQTLCSVEGAIILRRKDRYPRDEFDGQIVKNIKKSEMFRDTEVNTYDTYYYSAFPYSKQGVYNRSEYNRYGYRSAETITDLNIGCIFENSRYKIHAKYKKPLNTKSLLFVGSFNDYPDSPYKGRVLTQTSSDEYIDIIKIRETEIDFSNGNPYFYISVFSIDNNNVTNHKPAKVKIKIQKHKYLFGYDLNMLDSNPKTRVSYPRDVQNANYIAAKMNYNNSKFDSGGWNLTAGELFNPRPCMVDCKKGLVEYYLNPNDYDKKYQNDKDSGLYNRDNKLIPMVEWPKIYTKRWLDGDIYKFRCSDVKVDDTWECWNFYDKNGDEIDNFYTSIFMLTSDYNEHLISHPNDNSNYRPYTKRSFNNFITSINSIFSDNCTIFQYSDLLLIQDLLVLISKSTNLKEAFGYGGSDYSYLCKGNKKGMFWDSGNVIEDSKCNKIFGMENLWGHFGSYILGCFMVNGDNLRIKITASTKDGSKTSEFGNSGIGYLEYLLSSKNHGYINKTHITTFGRLPKDIKGSSTTYECDHFNGSNYPNITAVCLFTDPFGMYFTDPDNHYSNMGVRLTMKPKKQQ